MEPPDPSFADEFSVPHKYAVLVFDVLRRAAVSLPFQVHRLKELVEAGLVTFSRVCFEFSDKVPKEGQHGSLAHLPKIFASLFHGLSKVAVVGLNLSYYYLTRKGILTIRLDIQQGKVQRCRGGQVPAVASLDSSRDMEWVPDSLSPETRPNIKSIPRSSGTHAVSLPL